MPQNGAQCPTFHFTPPGPTHTAVATDDAPGSRTQTRIVPAVTPTPPPPPIDLVHTRQLSNLQTQAISLIAEGCNDTEVARRLMINRKTVNRWRLYDPVFMSRLNRARLALWANTLDQLRALLPTAVATLGQALQSDKPFERQRAAIQLLKIAGTSRLAPTIGPDNTRDILAQRQKEHERAISSDHLIKHLDPPTDKELAALHTNLINHIRQEEATEFLPTAPPLPTPLPKPPITRPLAPKTPDAYPGLPPQPSQPRT